MNMQRMRRGRVGGERERRGGREKEKGRERDVRLLFT